MKKYLFSVITAVVFILFASSCRMNVLKGEGNKGTVTATVPSFSAVDIDVSVKAVINVREGSQPGVQFDGYENIIKHIKTKVENNTLRIYSDLDDTWTMDCDDITAQITLPAITALSMQGAPTAEVHGSITGSEFKLDISGAGVVTVDSLNTDNFSSVVSGAGDIVVRGGAVKHAVLEISGAGKIKAFPLQSAELSATISGAGTSEVSATGKLTASISGAGTIKYKGHPTISQDVSGAGTITDAN